MFPGDSPPLFNGWQMTHAPSKGRSRARPRRILGRPRNDPGIRWRGDWVQRRRVALGLSRARVCHDLGKYGLDYSERTLEKWELGENPPRQVVAALASILACRSPEDLARPPVIA